MSAIDEHPEIDGASVMMEAAGLGREEHQKDNQAMNQINSIVYGANQLELNSMVSGNNSVMGSSPVKASRSTRSKIKPPGNVSKKRQGNGTSDTEQL